ncbi:MAG: protein kinase domain-containing protein [Isosphaeraceae bacterium]
MAARSTRCDPDRLRFSLEDRLSETDQSELAEHLEHCEACRQGLERLAAASQFWGDARLLLDGSEPKTPPTLGLGPIPFGTDDETDEPPDGSAWARLLDPAEPGRDDILGRLGSYEILQVLGQGGMGVVLKARDLALDRTVAIKVLTPALAHSASARRRFAREARAVAAVAHEHIVAIHNVDEFHGLPYLVMQYIPGRSLQERLDAAGPLELKEILRIGMQAARALAAAHAQGVVHRDIKPANILLENCVERVKLTDFGLARVIDDASVTQSGVIAGTPQYMAAEQARGEPVDARADLFSLGAVPYAMAVGRPPFRANSALAVLKRVCDDRHHAIRELNPDVPDWLGAVIDRLLAKEPAERFQSATEVAEILERGLAHMQQPTMVPRPEILALIGSAVRTGTAVPGPTIDRPDNPVGSAVRTGTAWPESAHEVRTADPTTSRRPLGRLAMVAGLLLVAMAGLGASEASGLTQVSEFVATVLRIKTPEGTLVVNVDDPNVKVDVDDETVIIGGAGPQELRLQIGKHHVQASRNGQTVKDEMVTIMKGKKEIVSIGFEPTSNVAARQPEAPGPMSAPRSHEAQCTACHESPAAANVHLPADHPPLEQGSWLDRNRASLRWRQVIPRGLVWSLAFSPDGRRLAIGQQGLNGHPGFLRLRDVAKQKDVMARARPSAYRCVAFSRDGKSLALGSMDQTVKLWDLGPGYPPAYLSEDIVPGETGYGENTK